MKHDVVTYKLHTKLENVGKVRTFWGGRKVVKGGGDLLYACLDGGYGIKKADVSQHPLYTKQSNLNNHL